MNKLILLLIALVGMIGAKAQWTSNCEVSSELEYYYADDVKDMAAQWLFDIHSPDTALIDIPQWCQDSIWDGLAAISNRYDIPEVDSVFNKYCVHRMMGFVNIKSIIVQLDPTCSWLNNWNNLQITTGVADLDSLLAQYNFTLTSFSTGYNWGVLYTTELINLYAVCDSLESFEGITYADPDGWGGSSAWYDHIYFNDSAGIRYYSFQIGIGLAGRYRWNFKVSADCSIEFLGNQGSFYYFGFPEPINCNIFTSVDETINFKNCVVYPNPTKDIITISSPSLTGITQLLIFNGSGEKVIEKQIRNMETQIDISALPRGIYFVRMQNEKMLEVEKMIKK